MMLGGPEDYFSLWGGHLSMLALRGATLPSLFISDVLDDDLTMLLHPSKEVLYQPSFEVHLVMRSSTASAWRCNCVVSSAPVLMPYWVHPSDSSFCTSPYLHDMQVILTSKFHLCTKLQVWNKSCPNIPQGDGLQVFWVSGVHSQRWILNQVSAKACSKFACCAQPTWLLPRA